MGNETFYGDGLSLIEQTTFAEKDLSRRDLGGRVTFQNIFSSMADFRDVVSVLLHAARLIKARKIFVAD